MDVGEAQRMASGVIERLAEELERGESETLQRYLAAMGKFHRYSLRNQMLIAQQRENATHVRGFWTWKRLGRSVRKGERGIVILAPIVRRRRESAETSGNTEEPVAEQDADDEEEQAVRFKAAFVFDISQTDGRSLPEFARVGGDPGPLLERLRKHVDQLGIPLRYAPHLAGADGMSTGGAIVLRSGLAPAEEFSTLVHELAHELLHKAGPVPGQTIRETESEAVAFAVCQAAGLDTDTAASDYIRLYDGKRDTLLESLTRIRSTAAGIIAVVVGDSRAYKSEATVWRHSDTGARFSARSAA